MAVNYDSVAAAGMSVAGWEPGPWVEEELVPSSGDWTIR